jgi:sulfite reductase (NADPH) hemoprotein beta-component
VNREQILKLLTPIIQRYAKERSGGEHFGDFVIRAGIVKATAAGNTFHDDVVLAAT